MSGTDWLGTGEELLSAAAKGAAAGSVVPGLGTAAGGLIGLASALVPHVFGKDAGPALQAAARAVTGQADEAGQVQALTADPQATEAFRLQVLQIAADREAARNTALQDRLDAGLADVADARKQTLGLAGAGSSIAWAAPVVSVVVLVAFGSLSCVVLFHQVPEGSGALANVLLGALSGMAFQCVNYWTGSSAGSARKDDLLRDSVPSALLPKPAALVPAADVPQ